MVDQVHMPENKGQVHKPVHPVKIGIMDQEHQRECKNVINYTPVTDFGVHIGILWNSP